jgi:hypothetical protein
MVGAADCADKLRTERGYVAPRYGSCVAASHHPSLNCAHCRIAAVSWDHYPHRFMPIGSQPIAYLHPLLRGIVARGQALGLPGPHGRLSMPCRPTTQLTIKATRTAAAPSGGWAVRAGACPTGLGRHYTITTGPFPALLRISTPVSVITTRSSIRTPPQPVM